MAKIIRLTPEYLNQIREEFETSLRSMKLADGKLSFSKSFGSIDRKATVYFTDMAWQKMQALIRECDKEVGWHGIAYRGDDPEKDEYFINDILVYPQEVTGATVTTDQEKYQSWLFDHDDDVFNNIRMQGHSHVNMGTTPSGVDTSLYERILDQLDDQMFYIFLIYNKRGEKTYKIYDLAKNVLFETADVTVEVLDAPPLDVEINIAGLSDEENAALRQCLVDYRNKKMTDAFVDDAMTKVVSRIYNSPANYTDLRNYGGYNYGGYGRPEVSYPSIAPRTPAAETPTTAPASSPVPVRTPAATTQVSPASIITPKEKLQESKKKSGLGNSSSLYGKNGKHRKGKRKDKKSSSGQFTIGGSWEDDDDDPYGAFGYSNEFWD